MQTFLPYSDFAKSAKVLDRARLGKQRVEVLQLVRGQWPNHPASKMWRGYELALAHYGIVICSEWISRGYQDTCLDKLRLEALRYGDLSDKIDMPPWLGFDEFHRSHRANLLRKSSEWYGQFWNEDSTLEYIWPLSDRI